jgi:hypothetical protein
VIYAFYAEHWNADNAADVLPYGVSNVRLLAVSDIDGRLHVER